MSIIPPFFIFVIVGIVFFILLEARNKSMPPQELTPNQENSLSKQVWIVGFLIFLFFAVQLIGSLSEQVMPDNARQIRTMMGTFCLFPAFILALLVISFSTIKNQICLFRGRGAYYYPTGGCAIIIGIGMLIIAGTLLVGFVMSFLQ
jgi:hypothetical protein